MKVTKILKTEEQGYKISLCKDCLGRGNHIHFDMNPLDASYTTCETCEGEGRTITGTLLVEAILPYKHIP
jgi:DnaJ-class molecular chaperone